MPVTSLIISIYFCFSLFTTTIYLLCKYSRTNTWTLFYTKMMSGFSFIIFYKIFFIIALSFFISYSNFMNEAKESRSIEFYIIRTFGCDKWVCMLFVAVFFYNTIPFTIAWTALFPSDWIVLTVTLFAISIAVSAEF